jgi:hypothetical protein
MSNQTDKNRIIALQKALRIARNTLTKVQYGEFGSIIEDAIYEIDKLDWNSKPDLRQN